MVVVVVVVVEVVVVVVVVIVVGGGASLCFNAVVLQQETLASASDLDRVAVLRRAPDNCILGLRVQKSRMPQSKSSRDDSKLET